MTSSNIYYVYAYIRSKDSETAKAGTPYYIGKGKGKRAYAKHSVSVPSDVSKIIFLETNLTDVGACAIERRLISWWGRKDNKTGILLNQTDGGDGASNPSEEYRRKIARPGPLNGMFGKTHTAAAKLKMSRKDKPHSTETKHNMSLARSNGNNYNAKRWYVITPSLDKIYVHDLSSFCTENQIAYNSLYNTSIRNSPITRGPSTGYQLVEA